MKKYYILFSLCVMMTYSLHSQHFAWIYEEEKAYNIPIGEGAYEELRNGVFYPEMEEYYHLYNPKEAIIQQLDTNLKLLSSQGKIEIEIYFGAWCGDSKEYLPAFMKIAERLSNMSEDNIILIGCDREKKAGDLDISDKQIEFVPTFVVVWNGIEMGRIVETPEQSLEEDLLRILQRIKK